MAGGYVQVDETPIDYLEPGHGKTRQGYLWTGSRPGGDVFFDWQTSRAAACLEQRHSRRTLPAPLQCDGYAAYRVFANGRGQAIELAGCWAHVRRKFYEAREQLAAAGGLVACAKSNNSTGSKRPCGNNVPDQRCAQAVRASAKPARCQTYRARLGQLKASGRHLPQSPLGRPLIMRWANGRTLEVYLEDGRVEIDNNLVENAIRPTAIGKKNWLFIGEADAGQRSAIIYTVIESCRRRGLDPFHVPPRRAHPPAQHDQPANPGGHASSLGQNATNHIINVI